MSSGWDFKAATIGFISGAAIYALVSASIQDHQKNNTGTRSSSIPFIPTSSNKKANGERVSEKTPKATNASRFSVSQVIRAAANVNPGQVSTVNGITGAQQTYGELLDRVSRLGTAIRETLNVKERGIVGILSLNSPRYLEYFFAVPHAGAWVCPVNIRLAPPEIAETLNDCECEVLFVDEIFAPAAPKLKEMVPSIKHVVIMNDDRSVPNGCTHNYEELIANVSKPMEPALLGGEEVYGLFYTGGTTGKSKGVMLTHNGILSNAYSTVSIMRYSTSTRYMHCAPMFHLADGASTFGISIVSGTHVFIPKFVPEATLQVIQAHKVTATVMVPAMIAAILQLPNVEDYDCTSLSQFLYGASPMSESLLIRAMKAFPKAGFIQGYGMTETAPLLTLLPSEYHQPGNKYLTSVGRAVPHVELRVVDENDNEVPRGTVGELIARGPNVMLGYYRMSETTQKALKNGWMHTGDGALMDEKGFVFIKDRMKDMIISGGENVYSAEVENAIMKLDGVVEVAVIGIPDDRLVEKVMAIVVPAKNANITKETIESHCRNLIAGYKIPRKVKIWGEDQNDDPVGLPKSGAGKILKTKLREPYWKNADRKDIYSSNNDAKTSYA